MNKSREAKKHSSMLLKLTYYSIYSLCLFCFQSLVLPSFNSVPTKGAGSSSLTSCSECSAFTISWRKSVSVPTCFSCIHSSEEIVNIQCWGAVQTSLAASNWKRTELPRLSPWESVHQASYDVTVKSTMFYMIQWIETVCSLELVQHPSAHTVL